MNDINRAIEVVKNGGVIIFPTDTIYGIGCRMDDIHAVKKVFAIRNRSEEKAVLAIVDSIAMAQEYLLPITGDVVQLMKTYWPGKLTIILPCLTEKVPAVVRGGGMTLGVRQTNNPILLEILKQIQVPLVAPSANFAGQKSPEKFEDIDPKLLAMVDYVLEGPTGGSTPSTVIDCSIVPWKIIRQGAITLHLS